MPNEVEEFIALWEVESGRTRALLETIPDDIYDFRPDPEGRSIGELAWHLAELEAIFSTIAREAKKTAPPAGIERPRTVPEIRAGYDRVHREAVERVRGLRPEDLDREFPFLDGTLSVRNALRFPLLHHSIHHRGQLMMLMRQAGAVPARQYGPSREDSARMRAAS